MTILNTYKMNVTRFGIMWSRELSSFLDFSLFHHFPTWKWIGGTQSWDIGTSFIIIRHFLHGHRGLISKFFVHRTTKGCTVALVVVLGVQAVLAATVVTSAASFMVTCFSCIHHAVFGPYYWGVSALDLPHFDSIYHHWWPVPILARWREAYLRHVHHTNCYLAWFG